MLEQGGDWLQRLPTSFLCDPICLCFLWCGLVGQLIEAVTSGGFANPSVGKLNISKAQLERLRVVSE